MRELVVSCAAALTAALTTAVPIVGGVSAPTRGEALAARLLS